MPFVFTVNPKSVDITYEVDTVKEGMDILNSEEMVEARRQIGSEDAESTPAADNTTAPPAAPAAEAPTTAKKRDRPAKNQPAPETATAPPPAPIPTAAPTPPVPPVPPLVTAPAVDDGSIPPFLKRDGAAAVPAPVAPPPAPSITLGPKIRAHIEAQAGDDATKKQYLDWLASPGIGLVIPNVSWDEAMGVLQYTTDAQCGGVAKALGVS